MPQPLPANCVSPVGSARSLGGKGNFARRPLTEPRFEAEDRFKMCTVRHISYLQEALLREHEQATKKLHVMAQELQQDNNKLRRQLELPMCSCIRSEVAKDTNADFTYWLKEFAAVGEAASREASRAEKVELPGRLIMETCEPVPESDEAILVATNVEQAIIVATATNVEQDNKKALVSTELGSRNGHLWHPLKRSQTGMTADEIHAKDFTLRPAWAKELSSKADRIAGQGPVEEADETQSSVSEKDKTEYPPCMLSPHSRKLVCWNLLFVVVLLYEMLMIPMATFDLPEDGAYRVASTFCMLFWSVDISITANTAFVDGEGVVVVSHRRIWWNYAKGWLVPDFVLVLIDWLQFTGLADASAGSVLRGGKAVKAFRVLRVLRILRMRKLRDVLQSFDEFINSQYFTIITSMVLNVCAILMISHCLGCVWFLIGTTSIPSYPSWVGTYDFKDKDWEYQYLTSLHWSITQFTPGSMHVQPQNILERAFAIAVLVAGMIIFSSIVSSITAATNGLKSMNARYKKEIWMMRRFCKEQHISKELLQRIMRYAENFIQPKMSKASAADVYLLRELPGKMHSQVMYEIFSDHLKKHPLFKKLDSTSTGTLADICTSCVEERQLDRKEFLFTPGEQAHQMYFIMDGQLWYHAILGKPDESGAVVKQDDKPDDRVLEANKEGEPSFIAEAVLWTEWVFQGSCHALLPSKILALRCGNFQETISEHRVDYLMLRRYARAYIDEMNELAGNTTVEDDDDRNLSDVLGEVQAAIKTLDQMHQHRISSQRQSQNGK